MNAFHHVTFTVFGRFQFPTDMLRHDCCFPVDSNHAATLTRAIQAKPDWALEPDGFFRLTLRCYTQSPTMYPTVDRWASFGWSVEKDSVQREIV